MEFPGFFMEFPGFFWHFFAHLHWLIHRWLEARPDPAAAPQGGTRCSFHPRDVGSFRPGAVAVSPGYGEVKL